MKKMKLNIQLFASGASCSVTVSETVGSATENTSTFTISAKVSTGSQTYNYSSAYVSGSYSGGASGSLSKQSFSINKSSSVTKSWTVTIPHNADGSLGDITFSIRYYVTDSSNGTATKTVTPTRIARYFSTTPVISLNSKTETTITYNWSTSEWCSAISLNGTGTLSGFGAGTSGTVTVSGLSANTNYTHSLTCTRSDSGLTTASNQLSNATYQWPYVSAIGSNPLIIGNGQTLTLYNPLGRNASVYMKQNNTSGTQFYSGSTTGTSISFTPTASTLYNSIPSATEGTACYYCTYSGNTVSTPTGKYKTTGNEKPTFPAGNVSISTNYNNLTNDYDTQIKGKTTVTVSVNTAATCNNGSSFSKYTIAQSGVTTQTLTTTTGSKTLAGGTSQTITVTAYDTRGYSTAITKNISELVDYIDPSIDGLITRTDGVGTVGRLNLSGIIFYDKFGNNGVANAITELKYRVSTTTTFSGSYTTIANNNIHYQTGSENSRGWYVENFNMSYNFVLGTKYYVEMYVADKLANKTVILTVTSGLIARDVYLKNGSYHTGINGLGSDSYTEQINGSLNVTGATNVGGATTFSSTPKVGNNPLVLKSELLNLIYPVGSIYMSVNNSSPASFLGGSWTQISGYFLLPWSDSAGTTGGNFNTNGSSAANTGSTTLTTAQIPWHNHGERALSGAFEIRGCNTGGTTDTILEGNSSGICSTSHYTWSGSHQRITTTSNSGPYLYKTTINATHTHDAVGGGQGHTHNMEHTHYHEPPWYKVYCWRRTA